MCPQVLCTIPNELLRWVTVGAACGISGGALFGNLGPIVVSSVPARVSSMWSHESASWFVNTGNNHMYCAGSAACRSCTGVQGTKSPIATIDSSVHCAMSHNAKQASVSSYFDKSYTTKAAHNLLDMVTTFQFTTQFCARIRWSKTCLPTVLSPCWCCSCTFLSSEQLC